MRWILDGFRVKVSVSKNAEAGEFSCEFPSLVKTGVESQPYCGQEMDFRTREAARTPRPFGEGYD